MKLAIYIFSIMCASVAYAGGDYFPIKIIELTNDSDSFHFKAEPTRERQWMEKECSIINVKGKYDTLRWLMHERPMSLDKHMQSIEFLSKSLASNKKVYFGYIGGGLRKIEKCSYESKGLVYENYDKELVLSVHDRI
jgi:hypothetical protein